MSSFDKFELSSVTLSSSSHLILQFFLGGSHGKVSTTPCVRRRSTKFVVPATDFELLVEAGGYCAQILFIWVENSITQAATILPGMQKTQISKTCLCL